MPEFPETDGDVVSGGLAVAALICAVGLIILIFLTVAGVNSDVKDTRDQSTLSPQTTTTVPA